MLPRPCSWPNRTAFVVDDSAAEAVGVARDGASGQRQRGAQPSLWIPPPVRLAVLVEMVRSASVSVPALKMRSARTQRGPGGQRQPETKTTAPGGDARGCRPPWPSIVGARPQGQRSSSPRSSAGRARNDGASQTEGEDDCVIADQVNVVRRSQSPNARKTEIRRCRPALITTSVWLPLSKARCPARRV